MMKYRKPRASKLLVERAHVRTGLAAQLRPDQQLVLRHGVGAFGPEGEPLNRAARRELRRKAA